MTWHTLPDCTIDEETLHGRCYNCGAREPEQTDVHRLFECPSPILVVGCAQYCACPRPLEDFENGYSDEFNHPWGNDCLWQDKANSEWGTGSIKRYLNRYYKHVDRLFEIACKDSPLMTLFFKNSGTAIGK